MKTSEYLERITHDPTYRRNQLDEKAYITKVIGWLAILMVPIAILQTVEMWSRNSDHISSISFGLVTGGAQLLVYERFRYQVTLLTFLEKDRGDASKR